MKKKYRGIITDRMNELKVKKTRYYNTYKEAHSAAEKLSRKYFVGERGEININIII